MVKKQLKQITVLTSILFIANFPNVLADETSSIEQKTAIITGDTERLIGLIHFLQLV